MGKPRSEMSVFERDLAREERRLHYRRNRTRINAQRRQRYRDDPEYAERCRESFRRWYAKKAVRRKRPVYKGREDEWRKEWNRKNRDRINAQRRQRYRDDPEFAKRERARKRGWRRRKRAQDSAT